ncbi:hypothetical protein WIA93_10420 [Citrobacter amalonaticus]|uniref:hypothetical protein n=1 Tax=Citrobacter amalonaticus TaxID=35703 RepID=UPI0011592733|nr:hypothetical protein [Citrobacter amalonaticus]QDK86573.1 hypothetical protein FEO47_14275 [Citrobacter amalonaticus]
MKLELKGRFNNTLIAFILDGGKDDSLLNMTELARRLDTSRSALVKYASEHGLELAIHHYLGRKRKKAAKRRSI